MTDVRLFPAWKHAIKVLVDEGLDFGGSVTRARMIELCEIAPPTSIEDVKRHDLEVLQCVSAIRDALLTSHSMDLIADGRGGYTVALPKDQTAGALAHGMRAISKEMRRMAMRTSFVRQDMLTDEERTANTDAQAKISRLSDLMAGPRRELLALAGRETE